MYPPRASLAGVALALLAPACAWTRRFDPPALIQPLVIAADEALARYPDGSERVELASASGARLAGVFVPADAGAPVVLHLLDSSGSVARKDGSPHGVAGELADLGLASLIVDYTGVGLSDGERSVRHLRADAQAAWQEAVRRAGGDPGQVVIRAISLGTIAAALLLEDGARPAALVWILPVFPDTVTKHFARFAYCGIAELVAWAFFRPVADVSLEAALLRARVPTTVIVSATDELTSAEERERLTRAAQESGADVRTLDEGHLLSAARARWILPEELELYRSLSRPDADERLARVLRELPPEIALRFPAGSPERERLRALAALQRASPAEDVAAAALGTADAMTLARWLWGVRRRNYPTLSFDERVDALSLDDPAGPLPIEAIETLGRAADLLNEFGPLWLMWGASSIASMARVADPNDPKAWFAMTISINGFRSSNRADLAAIFADLLQRTGSDEAARRQYARVLLKHSRIPDRLRRDGERWVVEALEDGSWSALDLEPAPRATVSAGAGRSLQD